MLSRFKRKREDEEEEPELMRLEKRPRRDGQGDLESARVEGPEDVGAMLGNRQQRQAGSNASNAEAARHRKRQDLRETKHSSLGGERSIDYLPTMSSTTYASQVGLCQITDRDLCEGPGLLTTPLQRTIESQFSLEILLKHQELRLIEEELAKCQIAYEQLRRCRLIPYPATLSTEPATDTGGIDAGLEVRRQDKDGPWAPAPGVTDGPYTRHYARWLIPDPMFDGEPNQAEPPAVKTTEASKTVSEGRTTRSNATEVAVKPNAGRIRGAPSKKQAPSSACAQPKDKSGSLIIRRSSDGRLVKLACLDCGRGNFSSAQGFINHCRIAHHRGFDSHDAAANACGEPVELDEAGNIVGDDQGGPASANSLIHPLVRSASTSQKAAESSTIQLAQWPGLARRKRKDRASSLDVRAPKKRGRSGQPKVHGSSGDTLDTENAGPTAFTPSSEVPRLSELLAKTGLGINLGGMVAEANHKFDLTIYSSGDEDEAVEEVEVDPHGMGTRPPQQRRPASMQGRTSTTTNPAPARSLGGLAPRQARMSPAISAELSSNPGRDNHGNRAGGAFPISTSSTVANTRAMASNTSAGSQLSPTSILGQPVSKGPSPPNLSPNTVDLNTAPSLVSDDEYEAHSDSESPSSDEDDEEPEFEVGDASDTTGPADPELTPVGGVKGAMPTRTASRRREEVPGGAALESRGTTTRERRSRRDITLVGPPTDTDHSGQGRNRSQRRVSRDKRTDV